jgi:hypothetical protein
MFMAPPCARISPKGISRAGVRRCWSQFGLLPWRARGYLTGYALHVQCAFQLRGRAGIVLASRDRYFPAGDPDAGPPGFAWDAAGANRLDEKVTAYFATGAPPVVRALRRNGDGRGAASARGTVPR